MHITQTLTRLTLSFPFSPATNATLKTIPGWKFENRTWSVPLTQAATLQGFFPTAQWNPPVAEIRSAAARYVCERINQAGLSVVLKFHRSELGFVSDGRVEVALLDGVLLPPRKAPSLLYEYEPEIRQMLEDGESFTVRVYGNPELDAPAKVEAFEVAMVSEGEKKLFSNVGKWEANEAKKAALMASRGNGRWKKKEKVLA